MKKFLLVLLILSFVFIGFNCSSKKGTEETDTMIEEKNFKEEDVHEKDYNVGEESNTEEEKEED